MNDVKWKLHTKFKFRRTQRRYHMEDLGIDGRAVLEWISEK
jgi:hypothetical protein